MKIESIKEAILQAIDNAQQQGYTLVTEDWGNKSDHCACALGCVLLTQSPNIPTQSVECVKKISSILNVSDQWIESFISGFDNTAEISDENIIEEAFLLGQEIFKLNKPIRYEQLIAKGFHK